MAKLPNKPRSGQKTIAALYRSICQVIDYLPSLTVKGDGKNIKVTNKDSGSIISVKNNNLSNWKYQGDYQKYIFGRGIKSEYDQEICSGLDGIPKELLPQFVTLNISGDGTYISASIPSSITDPVIISYIGPVPSGGGSGGVDYTPGSGISISSNVIQTTFEPGCDIWFWDHSNDEASPGNYITIENGLSAGFGIKFKDNNPQGDYHMHYIGVDLVGGDYISIVTGTNSAGTPDTFPTIRCNLSATGYIGLSTVYLNQYDTGAVITTNLHGDGTTVTIDNDGTIHSHTSGGTGGQTLSAASGINIFASGGVDYIETTFRPGVDIYFWDHNEDSSPQNVITIQNGLSAGNGITFRDNTIEEGVTTYHQHYIDWSVSATHWLDYNSGYAVLSCTLNGDNNTVFIGNDGTISSFQYTGGTGIQVNNTTHTISLTADIPGSGASYTAGSGIIIETLSGDEYIRSNFQPGVDIYFWDHNNDSTPEDRITIENGLSAGNGITFRDNTSEQGVSTYHQHYIDWSVSATHWLDYNSGYTLLSCTLDGDNSTVYIGNDGTISANVWQYNSGTGISVDNSNHTITLTANVGQTLSAGSGIVIYTSGGSDYIRTNLEPGCDIWFWDHNNDSTPEDRITIENGLSAGHGITFRDNSIDPQVTTYNQHYMDVDISGGQWLEYNVSAATMSCTLTGDNQTVFINENGVISAQAAAPSTVYDKLSQGSGILLTKLSDGRTKIDCTVQGGGGGGEGYIRWPNYAALANSGSDALQMTTDYKAGSAGGWLRISYKGEAMSGCWGVHINNNQIGLWHLNAALGNIGNTWLIPIPPYANFYVNFPAEKTQAYFDSTKYTQQEINDYYYYITGYAYNAQEQKYSAESDCGDAQSYSDSGQGDYEGYVGKSNIDPVSNYQSWWNDAESEAQSAANAASNASSYADNAIAQYNSIYENEPIQGKAAQYRDQAIAEAQEAANYAASALIWADRAHYYYVLRRDHNNLSWYNTYYQPYDPSHYPYDYTKAYPYY